MFSHEVFHTKLLFLPFTIVTALNIDIETTNNTEKIFDKATEYNLLISEKHSLNIMTQNIRCIQKSFDSFSVILNDIDISFDVNILNKC